MVAAPAGMGDPCAPPRPRRGPRALFTACNFTFKNSNDLAPEKLRLNRNPHENIILVCLNNIDFRVFFLWSQHPVSLFPAPYLCSPTFSSIVRVKALPVP